MNDGESVSFFGLPCLGVRLPVLNKSSEDESKFCHLFRCGEPIARPDSPYRGIPNLFTQYQSKIHNCKNGLLYLTAMDR